MSQRINSLPDDERLAFYMALAAIQRDRALCNALMGGLSMLYEAVRDDLQGALPSDVGRYQGQAVMLKELMDALLGAQQVVESTERQ